MQAKRFIVLDSDGESNYKYDYQYSNNTYFVEVYKDNEFWYQKEVTPQEFKRAEKESDIQYRSIWGVLA